MKYVWEEIALFYQQNQIKLFLAFYLIRTLDAKEYQKGPVNETISCAGW